MDFNSYEIPSRVTIIGGAGRMGLWFTKYFIKKECQTVISDVRIEKAQLIANETGASLATNNISAVKNSNIVIVCAPIKSTPEIISDVAPFMKRGAILAEISSIKKKVVESLSMVSSYGIQPLSIHPMFGPTVGSLEGKTIVVVPVLDKEFETEITRNIFSESKIIVANPDVHDRVMALNLSLVYFLNLALGKVISRDGLEHFKSLAGTTFTIQLALLESVIQEDHELVKSLLEENEMTLEYIDRFILEVEYIRKLIEKNASFEDLFTSLRDVFKVDPDFQKADERRYRAYKALIE